MPYSLLDLLCIALLDIFEVVSYEDVKTFKQTTLVTKTNSSGCLSSATSAKKTELNIQKEASFSGSCVGVEEREPIYYCMWMQN